MRACVCLLSELSELCQQLRLLEDPVSQDVDALIAAASVEPSPRAVRDFKSKLDAVRLAYEPLMEQMLEVAKSDAHTFPQFAATDATKAEIKQAVELLFDVKVAGVTVVNSKGKKKRFGQVFGRRNDTKKAYVKLAEGSDIDFLGGE